MAQQPKTQSIYSGNMSANTAKHWHTAPTTVVGRVFTTPIKRSWFMRLVLWLLP